MFSLQRHVNALWQTSVALRAGAGLIVLVLHASVIRVAFSASDSRPALQGSKVVMVSLIQAPRLLSAKMAPSEPVANAQAATLPQAATAIASQLVQPLQSEPKLPPQKPSMRALKLKPVPQLKQQSLSSQLQTATASNAVMSDTREGLSMPPSLPTNVRSDQPILLSHVEYWGTPPLPVYPLWSKRAQEEGRVIVLVFINPQGWVDRAALEKSSGFPRLDESALTAARKARFKPLMRNGIAYAAQAKLPFDFVMRN
jgi:protein TonB